MHENTITSRAIVRQKREAQQQTQEQREQDSHQALTELLHLIQDIPKFIAAKNDTYTLLFYKEAKTGKRDEEYKQVTLVLPFLLLTQLTPADFYTLKREFKKKVEESLTALKLSLVPAYQQFIDPDNQANVLQHEFDHNILLPKKFHQEAEIHIHFPPEWPRQVSIDGSAWVSSAVNDQLTPQQQAHMSSNPQLLSKGDILSSLATAEKTQNPTFIEHMREWIKIGLPHFFTHRPVLAI